MIVDKYPMRPEAAKIIKAHWPANLMPASFPQAMRDLQAALIRFHWAHMNVDTRKRAMETLSMLEGGNCPLQGSA